MFICTYQIKALPLRQNNLYLGLMLQISIIAAVAENNALGKGGDLLCHLPIDLKHFKATTLGAPVIMGSHTYISLPRRPLPKRRNIVITSRDAALFEGAEVARSLEEALRMTEDAPEVFIIGGGIVYREALPLADKLYLTHIHHAWEDADTFFPTLSASNWQEVSREEHPADEQHAYPYTLATYLRKEQ